MKLSQFNIMAEIEPEQSVLYNTLSRDYILLDKNQSKLIQGLLENFHRDSYSQEEADAIIKLAQKKFVIRDNLNELNKIKTTEEALKTQNGTHIIVFKTTLDCNFRCTYCTQFHDPIKMTDDIQERMIDYIKIESKNHKNIHMVWFGGEPLLEIERMKSMSQSIIEICTENDCKYSASIVTNGYLLNDEVLSHFKLMRIEKAQITVDGVEKYHNLTRPHMNGEGTFNTIYDNILKLLALETELTLRININKDNYLQIGSLLDLIPIDLRKKIRVSMANWFQTTPKLSLYSIYNEAIEKGYFYSRIKNNFNVCERSYDNSVSVLPNGEIVICSQEYKLDSAYGVIEKGEIVYSDDQTILKMKNRPSITENERCSKCIELPICMGGCPKARIENTDYCAKFIPDGLSVEEKIKLHIKHDQYYNPEVIYTL